MENIARSTIWLDVADFYEYAKAGNTKVAGIQRVVANLQLASRLVDRSIIPVIPDYYSGSILAPDEAVFSELVTVLQDGSSSWDRIAELAERVGSSRTIVHPRSGDVFVLAGCFWIYPSFDCLAALRTAGVKIALFVHDLIQVKNPEFVSAEAARIFARKLSDIAGVADLWLTNSDYVARDLEQFLAVNFSLRCPVIPVPLATQGPDIAKRCDEQDWDLPVSGSEFVLFVSTIEIRKNHKLLIAVWERLRNEYPGPVPKLVFAGKWGWLVEDLRAEIDRKGIIDDWLIIRNSLSDLALASLYRKALFTIYPSFAEGWGLPVGESLSYGTPCVASNAMSIPEVGGDFARYFDPGDAEGAYRLVVSLLSDRVMLQEWRNRIRQEFRPRPWAEFSREFYDLIVAEAVKPALIGSRLNYRLPAGRILHLGDRGADRLVRSRQPLVTARMARVSGWTPAGELSASVCAPDALLEFRSSFRPGTPIVVFLQVQCPTERVPNDVLVEVGGTKNWIALETHPHLVTLHGTVGHEGRVIIKFCAPRLQRALEIGSFDRWLELFFLAFEHASDAAARAALLEKVYVEGSYSSSYPGALVRSSQVPVKTELWEEIGLLRRFLIEQGKPRRPRNALVRLASAWLLLVARRRNRKHAFSAAERAYRRLLLMNPNRARLWIEYGNTVQARGDLAAALAAYRIAIRIDGNDADVRRCYADALDFVGRADEAISVRNGPDRIAEGTSI